MKFSELKPGQAFIFNGEACIKINMEVNGMESFVELRSGDVHQVLSDYTVFMPVDTNVTISMDIGILGHSKEVKT